MKEFIEVPANKKSLAQRKLVFGVGVNDANYIVHPIIDGKNMTCPYYSTWRDMLKRCYNIKFQKRRHTYKGCSVVKSWLTFSNFKYWMDKQDWIGKQLDKDILVSGNKIYSPDTCVFVSGEINTLLVDCAASRGEYPQGVAWHKRDQKYQVYCNVRGKPKYLGSFNTVDEAELVYLKFKINNIELIAGEQSESVKLGLLRHAQAMKYRIGEIKANNNPKGYNKLINKRV